MSSPALTVTAWGPLARITGASGNSNNCQFSLHCIGSSLRTHAPLPVQGNSRKLFGSMQYQHQFWWSHLELAGSGEPQSGLLCRPQPEKYFYTFTFYFHFQFSLFAPSWFDLTFYFSLSLFKFFAHLAGIRANILNFHPQFTFTFTFTPSYFCFYPLSLSLSLLLFTFKFISHLAGIRAGILDCHPPECNQRNWSASLSGNHNGKTTTNQPTNKSRSVIKVIAHRPPSPSPFTIRSSSGWQAGLV